jgi:Tfp pilus assembly protein FimT
MELMVVVAIMGMALLVSAPAIQGFLGSKRIEQNIDSLTAHMDLARHVATAQNNPVEIFFSADNGEYWLLDDDNGDGAADDGERIFGPYALSQGVTLDVSELAADGRLVFQPSGVLAPGQGGTISLTSDRGDTYQVEVFNSGTISRIS